MPVAASMNSRSITRRQISTRSSSSRRPVKAFAQFQPFSSKVEISKVAPAFLAAIVSVTAGFAVPDVIYPAPAYADEEEVDESTLTPYEKRQRDLAKRRELLRQAREKAMEKASTSDDPSATTAANAAVEAANEQRRNAAEELKSSLSTESLSFYEQQATKKKSPFSMPEPTPAPAPAAAPVVEEPKPAPAPFFRAAPPKPTPPPPAPAPAPVVVAPKVVEAPKPAPAAKQEVKKQEAPKKRRGPLPTFLAELLVLGAYAGMAAAATKYSKETSAALGTARSAVISAYQQAEKALAAK